MKKDSKYLPLLPRMATVFCWLLIALGIVIRLAIYFQNRNLFIDEANVARNIFERNFLELATPLSYEQYAPPIFLWGLELFTGLFGYSEYAFRIYPLLAGIGTLIVLYYLLKEITSWRSMWYPIGMMAVSYFMIRYSSELKQYMSDALVVLALILLAIRTDIEQTGRKKFLLTWFIAGSVAIWAAMPSVFVLAGVGVYYFLESLKRKQVQKSILIIVTGLLWLVQFGIYYYLILKPQIDSNYLQTFHQEFFLYATPGNAEELKHNWHLINNLVKEASGFNTYANLFNLLLLVIGTVAFLYRDFRKSLLFLVPLAAAFVAAALNQYSLIPRVALFMMPLFLVLMGYGLEQLMRVKYVVVPVVAALAGVVFIYFHNMAKLIVEPLETEQVTEAMDFVIEHDITSPHLYLHNGARPAFIYYTQIHPAHSKWGQIRDAHLLYWDSNYDAIAAEAKAPTALIFTSVYGDDLHNTRQRMEQHLTQVAERVEPGSFVYIYLPKQDTTSLQNPAQ